MRTSTILLVPAAMTALLIPLTATGATASAAAVGEPCADGAGVTVVVDLSDLHGEVQIGCAPGDPTTGREALTAAGFTSTDDAAGMICAVAGLPDPCPETFDGSYWSYWTAESGADWTAYQVGADQSDPVPGTVEGWRYFDGSSGPTVLPAALEATSTVEPSGKPSDEAVTTDTATDTAADSADSGPSTGVVAAIGVLAVLLAAAVVTALRRRRSASNDSADV